MTQVLCFSNPGELDTRLITTFGANVKPNSDSPIGYFGTGLKYAIAVALRADCKVEIQVGLTTYQFTSRSETIRGKEFSIVCMNGEPCGFTLDLGRNWQPWMAYREFWANAQDEQGETALLSEAPLPAKGETRVLVGGAAMIEAHNRRHEFILQSVPLWRGRSMTIHQGPAKGVFYRGFLVAELPLPPIYTYNILSDLRLTEDRVAASSFDVNARIVRAICDECDDPKILANVLGARQDCWEHKLDYSWSYGNPATPFMTEARKIIKATPTLVNRSMVEKVQGIDSTVLQPEPALLTKVEQVTLVRAIAFAKKHGFEIDQEVLVTDSLGESVLGTVLNGVIYLSRRVFMMGTKMVCGTLIEEHLHAKHGFIDCSREMQNYLFDRLISAYEDVQGEPL